MGMALPAAGAGRGQANVLGDVLREAVAVDAGMGLVVLAEFVAAAARHGVVTGADRMSGGLSARIRGYSRC